MLSNAGAIPRRVFLGSVAVGSLSLSARPATAAGLTVAETKQIALETYIYGYSLVTSEVTRVQMTNVAQVEALRAPMNSFFNVKKYPPASYKGVSGSNADTLYSVAWLDLAEPQIVSKPDTGERFWVLEMADMWMTVFAAPDLGTDGGAAKDFLLTGPGWTGDVPAGLKHIAVPTGMMAIVGRTFSTGSEEDYAIVNAIQAKYRITPLSAWGKPFTFAAPAVNPDPGFSMTDKPIPVIRAFSTADYFNMVAKLTGGVAPPAAEDAPLLARAAMIGLVPGQPFDVTKLDPQTQAALKDIPTLALELIDKQFRGMGEMVNGWKVAVKISDWAVYGTNYLQRAAIAAFGWPGELPRVSVYPIAFVDGKGEKLTGLNRYSITFPKGGLPPADAFWSITMYQIDEGYWFYPNALNRLTINQPRDKLAYNTDGSLTVYVQHESPGSDRESNWLPAPAGPFALCLRMYLPRPNAPSILDGSWSPPPLLRAA